MVHGSTYAKNDLAMAAGIATLEVMKHERIIARADRLGERLRLAFTRLFDRYEFVREVRGKGLMIGIEFGPPTSLKLKASWNLLEAANKGLFCQLVTIPLFKRPQDADPGRRPCQPHHQAAAAAHHHR